MVESVFESPLWLQVVYLSPNWPATLSYFSTPFTTPTVHPENITQPHVLVIDFIITGRRNSGDIVPGGSNSDTMTVLNGVIEKMVWKHLPEILILILYTV
jgi:hypothetical protein